MTVTIKFHDVEQGTPEWHALRDNLYTGTDADKLLSAGSMTKIVDGVSKSYASKDDSSFSGNYSTKRGHILEDEAIEIYNAIHKTKARIAGFVTNNIFPTCGYSPDGIDVNNDEFDFNYTDGESNVIATVCASFTLLEVKCFKQDKHLKLFNGDIPLKIRAQIHFGMMICGIRQARLIIYHPQLDLGDAKLNAKYAYKEIGIKANPLIFRNFRRILTNGK